MDKLVLTDTGGFPLKLDDFLWQNGELDASNWGMYDAIEAHLLAYGTDYIVEGCTYAAPNITAGWIMLGGELMRVDAHAGTDDFFVRTVTFDARGSKTFKDSGVNNTYEKIRGVLSGASGSLDITAALRLEDKIIQLIATSAQQFAVGNIPDLPASKTTSGTFAVARLPQATTAAIGAAELAIQGEVDSGADAIKIVTPATLRGTQFVSAQLPDNGSWQTPSFLNSNIAYTVGDHAGVKYRLLANGFLQIFGSFQNVNGGVSIVFTLGVSFRLNNQIVIKVGSGDSTDQMIVYKNGDFEDLASTSANNIVHVNAILPLDSA